MLFRSLFYIATPTYFLPGYFIPLVLHKIKTTRERRLQAPSSAAAGPLTGHAA